MEVEGSRSKVTGHRLSVQVKFYRLRIRMRKELRERGTLV